MNAPGVESRPSPIAGLGLFAVRHNAERKNEVRETPGRFVGKAKDNAGRDCIVMVLSTREQHIRKDKATSNICSNQAFIATIAGAAILARGEAGMAASCVAGRDRADAMARGATDVKRVVHDVITSLDGSISAEHGIGVSKRDELARCKDPLELELMRSVKQALDPQGLLNPGKIFDLRN